MTILRNSSNTDEVLNQLSAGRRLGERPRAAPSRLPSARLAVDYSLVRGEDDGELR